MWSANLNRGSWGEATADANDIATLIIEGLDATGTDYRLFVVSSTSKYIADNYQGTPIVTTGTNLSNGDSTTMASGTLANWMYATHISMAANIFLMVTVDNGGTISSDMATSELAGNGWHTVPTLGAGSIRR